LSSARNGQSPGEESRLRRRCGTGDRGEAVLGPDQAIRGRVARATGSSQGEGWQIYHDRCKKPGLHGRGKRKLCVRKGNRSGSQRPVRDARPLRAVEFGDRWGSCRRTGGHAATAGANRPTSMAPRRRRFPGVGGPLSARISIRSDTCSLTASPCPTGLPISLHLPPSFEPGALLSDAKPAKCGARRRFGTGWTTGVCPGTSSPHVKLTGDFSSAIEVIRTW
jgi:hypothetical protein